jgi:hemerythrin-like domain-containing protein
MIPVEEFRSENKEILDLCRVLNILILDYELRKNPIVCELLDRFLDRVNQHISHEDRSVYGDLLAKHTDEASKLASHFLGNTQELKRIIKSYKKDWCQSDYEKEQHENYVKETKSIIKLVCDRIDFENEKIFPVFEGTAA